jgi:hypothetical protein
MKFLRISHQFSQMVLVLVLGLVLVLVLGLVLGLDLFRLKRINMMHG